MPTSKRPRRSIIPGTRGGPLTNISFLYGFVRLSEEVVRMELGMCNEIDENALPIQLFNIAEGEGVDFPAAFNSEGDVFPCSSWEIHDGVIDLTFAGIALGTGTLTVAAWEPVLTTTDGIWCGGGFFQVP